MASDPPPAYCTLATSTTNLPIESVQNCDEDNDDRSEILDCTFENKTTRIAFVQKVLAVKFLQSLLFLLILSIFKANDCQVQQFLESGYNFARVITVSVLSAMVTVWLPARACRSKDQPQSPLRYLFLVLHPVSLAFFVAVLTLYFEVFAPVLVAWLSYCGTGFVLLLYSIFALQTRIKFALKHSLFLAAFTHIVLYAFSPLFGQDAFYVLYPSTVLALDTAYVLWDLAEMTGRRYWAAITPADFLDAALNLHLDYYFIIKNNIGNTTNVTEAVERTNNH